MIILGPWVGYVDRTYQQIKANILTKFQGLVPEITDHTETNPWVKAISIWSNIAEMLGYYIDTTARETFITTAQEFESAAKLAALFDYRIKGSVPASTDITFTLSANAPSDYVIPAGTEVETDEGLTFLTTIDGTIPTGSTSVAIPAKQWESVTGYIPGASDGSERQEFRLEANVVDGSPVVTIAAQVWQAQETLAYSFPADQHYVGMQDIDQVYKLVFGDDLNGAIPGAGNDISVDYYVSDGGSGNIGANQITNIVTVLTPPGGLSITANNINSASGGADAEDLADLKKRVPYSIRTRYRAVTREDFVYLTEIFAGVEKAGVVYEGVLPVKLYIVPEGGGLASGALLTDVFNYIEKRRVIMTPTEVFSAGSLEFIINADVKALPGYLNSAVSQSVKTNIINFFSTTNQAVQGVVNIGDVYEVIEATTGVQNSIINLILPVPYARPLNNTTALSWSRTMLVGSNATKKWLIRFINGTTYELFRNDIFLGSFAVGAQVDQDEITMNIADNGYVAGNNYEFYTYNYNVSVALQEPSIPATSLSRLTINVSGGV